MPTLFVEGEAQEGFFFMEYQKYVAHYWDFCDKQHGVLKPYDGFMYFFILDRCFRNQKYTCTMFTHEICTLTHNSSRAEINRSLTKLHTLGFIILETKISTNNSCFNIELPIKQIINHDKAILFVVKPVVYIAYNPSDSLYKIGVTNNILDRGRGLKKYGKEVKIIAWFNGGYSIEKQLHKHFDSKRIYSEWFSLDQTDLGYIFEMHEVKTITYGK